MQSILGSADAAASATTEPSAQGGPKRRHRVDSNPSANWGPPAASLPDPKRPRAADAVTMSAKALGKRPEMPIDLTRPYSIPHSLDSQRPTAFQPHAGVRKLVVKNLRATPTGSTTAGARAADVQGYYRRAREQLDAAVTDILSSRPPSLPLDRLFRAVEDVCRNGEAAALHDMLRQRCEAHLQDVVLPRIKAEGAGSDIEMLRTVRRYWTEWSAWAVTIRSTFSYLDRTFLLNNKEHPSLNDTSINLFRRAIFVPRSKDPADAASGAKLLSGMCRLVELNRNGDRSFDKQLLLDAVNMLHVFNVYGKAFEPRFLAESRQFFANFAEERSEGCPLERYVADCQALISSEDTRCNEFGFDSTTKKQLLDDLHRIAVQEYTAKLLHRDDVGRLLDEGDMESLRALYDLLRMSSLHPQLIQPWEHYIVTTGASVVNDSLRADEVVIRLLALRRNLELVVRDAFSRDNTFTEALKTAFKSFINDKANVASSSVSAAGTSKVGEMVAKYFDMLLRGGLKALPPTLLSDGKDRSMAEQAGGSTAGDEDAELDRQLDKGLALFRDLDGKDVFEAFYKRDLARRLLLGRSASHDAERLMLTKLKTECGSNFTHNLEQMFKDQELGKEELLAYQEWRDGSASRPEGSDLPKIDLSVSVLNSAAWPSYPDEPSVVLPPGILQNLNHFERYYKSKHSGRVLSWKHSLSHCVLKASFPKGVKELVVSAHQAAVLVLFNEVGPEEPIGCWEIEKGTGLTGGLLERTLQSLACGKVRVLTKAPRGRDVAKTDTFVLNKGFSDPKFRVKINQIQLRETTDENKATHERVAADRHLETQAAIVRIMKSRKTMPHAQLVAEVIDQTRRRGAMDPADIKVNIEKLLEKEYIERDGKNSYSYVA